MKDLFVHRVARGPIVPLITVICVLLGGAGPARADKTAQVEVGFVGVPPTSGSGTPIYQNVLLNVRSVRINPNVDAAPGNSKWRSIPVPPAIGGSGQSADLQIDLNTSQNIPQLFNTAGVQPGTYRIAELLLDSANPGSIVPNCPKAPPLGANNDGCIAYPIQLAPNTNVITVSNPTGLIFPPKGTVTPLILQVSMAINSAPTTPGGAYTVTITLATLPANPLGTVTGSVKVNAGTGSGSSPTGKLLKLAVTAEAIGTNTPIASALVKNGVYTLELPAAGGPAAPGFGTLYDLAVAGGENTYAADRLVPLYPGQKIPKNEDFTITGGQKLGNITGTITDNCVATKTIAGATLQLLIPPDSNNTADCLTSPEQCVTVATAFTDNAGNFPLPGTLSTPPQFANVPPTPKSKSNPNGAYAMEITAPGYDPLIVQAKPSSGTSKKGGGTCAPKDSPAGATFTACNLALNTGYISGTVPIIPPNPGQTTLVQVFAEDAGTNNIVSALSSPVTVRNSSSGSVSFTLNVPTALLPLASFRKFDLFAATIDLYQGVADPYPGHTIAVRSDVTGPAAPSAPGACSIAPAAFAPDQTITCAGHGSVAGLVGNADLGTSVVLSKEDALGNFVQITNTQVQNQSPNPGPNNGYSFCAPADTYWLQTVQMPAPSPDVTPLVAPTPEPMATPTISAIIPTPLPAGGPSPTPTPAIKCPTSCSHADGTCPGLCNTVFKGL